MKELAARIAARLRASDNQNEYEHRKVLSFGDLVIDSVKHEITLSHQPVRLTMTEFKLLRHMVANKGRAFSRNELLDAAISPDAVVVDRNVDVHIATLRKKLGAFGRNIETIRGLGYKVRDEPVPAE